MALVAVAVAAVAGAYALGSRRAATQAAVSPQRTAAPQNTTAMPTRGGTDEALFWRLVAETRAAAGNDTARQSELLDARLRRLRARQIASFARIRRSLDRQLYTWDVWGAAYVIDDGCSDDCFRDFRGYLISLGRGPYETALRNPDALAPIVDDAETGDWENADDVAPDAYQGVTGHDMPGDTSDLSGNPRGAPWNQDHVEALVQRYPQLAARFR
jgi:hypothetical protein